MRTGDRPTAPAAGYNWSQQVSAAGSFRGG